MASTDVLALQNASGTEVFAVDQSGNLDLAGTLGVTGAVTLSSDLTMAGNLFLGVTTVAMADAAHALVLGTAGAGETQLTGSIVVCDPASSGASEILTLPPEASSVGLAIIIVNSGGEGIVVNDDAAGTVITLDTAQHGLVVCDGTTWRGFMGGVT